PALDDALRAERDVPRAVPARLLRRGRGRALWPLRQLRERPRRARVPRRGAPGPRRGGGRGGGVRMMNAEEGHLRGREAAPRRGGVLVLAAHPDDETIGAGALLYRLHGAVVVHLTDGAPRDPRFRPDGLEVDAYARARRRELGAALAAAGLGEKSALGMGVADQ